MKKTILGLLLIGFTFQSYAQTDVLFEAKIKKEKVPALVITAVEKDFPDAIVEEYTAIPVEFIEDDVIIDRNIKSIDDYNSYQITLRDKNERLTATYNKKGDLISEIAYGKNVPLPRTVLETVAKAFPKWAIIEDTYKMVSHANGKKNERYKIIIEKGNEMKKVIVDASGNIISVHKRIKL